MALPLSLGQTVSSDDLLPSSSAALCSSIGATLSSEKLILTTKLRAIHEIVKSFPHAKANFQSQEEEKFIFFKQIFKEVPVLKEIPNNFRLKVPSSSNLPLPIVK